MNVIHTVPSLGESDGGPPRSVSQLCNILCQQESSIGIVTVVKPNDPIVPLDAGIQLTTLEAKSSSLSDRFRATDFGSALDHIDQSIPISVVHQHGIWLRSSHAVTRFAHENKLPLVVAPRGMLEPWALNHHKLKKKLAWALYQERDLEKATAFHATAQSEADSIRRLGLKQPIAVIPNGVQLPEEIDCEGGSLGRLEGDRKTALFLSRINPKKGLPMLLDVWKKLAPENWLLVIAGNDDSNHLPVIERKISEHGLGERVIIAGPLFNEAKEAAYRSADLFVLPSYSENFGIVVAEALSFGVPVLTTTGCPWQELQTHKCGWWVEPTPAGIETALNDALRKTNEELSSMGRRGRQLVEKNYQWSGIAERMLEFYDWLLDGGRQPAFIV
jgi:glycosyltransferase involved in cell wall biosynthesis